MTSCTNKQFWPVVSTTKSSECNAYFVVYPCCMCTVPARGTKPTIQFDTDDNADPVHVTRLLPSFLTYLLAYSYSSSGPSQPRLLANTRMCVLLNRASRNCIRCSWTLRYWSNSRVSFSTTLSTKSGKQPIMLKRPTRTSINRSNFKSLCGRSKCK